MMAAWAQRASGEGLETALTRFRKVAKALGEGPESLISSGSGIPPFHSTRSSLSSTSREAIRIIDRNVRGYCAWGCLQEIRMASLLSAQFDRSSSASSPSPGERSELRGGWRIERASDRCDGWGPDGKPTLRGSVRRLPPPDRPAAGHPPRHSLRSRGEGSQRPCGKLAGPMMSPRLTRLQRQLRLPPRVAPARGGRR